MALQFLNKVFGTKNDRELKRMGKVVQKINDFEAEMEGLSEEQLKGKRQELS